MADEQDQMVLPATPPDPKAIQRLEEELLALRQMLEALEKPDPELALREH